MTHENSGDLKITDETIMAFIDGELDQFSRLEFESALQKDSDLRYKVDQLRQNDAMLFNSLKVATDTPLPSVTMPTAKPKRLPSRPAGKLDIIPSWSDFRSFFTAPVACYTAAVLCLGVLIGNTFSIFDRNYISSQTEFEQTLVISAAINMALEKELSGTGYGWSNLQAKSNGEVTPLKTWKNQDQQYCREFKLEWTSTQQSESLIATACRVSEGYWKPHPPITKLLLST